MISAAAVSDGSRWNFRNKKEYERERDAVMTEEKTIGVIKAELKAASDEMLPSFISAYKMDPRSGVQTLVSQAKNVWKSYTKRSSVSKS